MLNEDKKRSVLAQIKAVLEGETDMIARMANAAALLHEGFGFWWTGFYRVLPVTGREKGAELVLGPFQGPVACQRIAFGRGVCGTAWKEARTIVVPDVELFPGHIACSSESRSEVVVPLLSPTAGKAEAAVFAVLDIDSRELATFDESDVPFLEEVAAVVAAAPES